MYFIERDFLHSVNIGEKFFRLVSIKRSKILSRSGLYQNTIVKKQPLEILSYSYSSKFVGSCLTLLKCGTKFLAVTGISLNNFESHHSKFKVTISTEIP